MLISQPFLSAAAHEDDSTQPVTTLGERSGKGAFPVSREFGWHGGIHLEAQGNADSSEPVCAIADGEVVFARGSDDIPQHHDDPAVIAAHPLLYYKGWTSNGVVILKHATEIGEGVNVEFYSIYQHMHTTQVTRGSRVYRKDAIGLSGAIYGQPNRIHFEIVADATSVVALMGRNHGPLAAEQGRTNSLWGDIHVVLPVGTQLYASDPSVGSAAHPAWQVPVQATTTEPAIVSITESTGLITLTTRSIRGAVLGSATPEDAYGLYERATRRYPGCPSAGYEMLRFGRVIGPDAPAATDLYQGRLPHIRQIHSPVDHTAVYANLNGPGVRVYSDADFPDWLGWTFVDDDTDGNSRCDSDVLIALLDPGAPPAVSPPAATSGAAAPTPAEQQAQRKRERIARAYARSLDGPMRERLSYCVVKMPTEWSRDDFDTRWGWLKGTDPNDLPASALMTGCLSPDAYTKLKQHHAALAFWEDAQAQGLTLGKVHYHFHPGRFIQMFKKCGWRSLRELTQTLPKRSSPNAGGEIPWQTAQNRWHSGNNDHGFMPPDMHTAINRMWRKYGFSTPQRQAHFLAQIFKETGALRATVELGDSRYFRTMYEALTPQEAGDDFDHKHDWLQAMGFLHGRNRPDYIAQRPDEVQQKAVSMGNTQTGDGARFRGRGLIHLTGRGSYAAYSRFRGRDFTTDPNPELLSSDATAVADSAGYFWISKVMQSPNTGALRSGMNIDRRADVGVADANVAAITTPVNGGSTGLPQRREFFHYVNFILGDAPNMPTDPSLMRQREE
ncbi:hydroxyethylthiazole kinase [Paraburkholderia sp. BL6669N2]|uniref:peptidoglycan DD-metalloendopeptidase family protein n=1 Tax=Paraburkholderia sp. BL6669N2 TaxID=1938807 RepID=UPI000E289939|nr:peptidoglycan DD-metalloendopeptidase family protein [Paraburkholderia sp. BL6669N2]REG59789.1 hydroxyethylthiazole kinase [Paraburkholderia sp. BL6669N2]